MRASLNFLKLVYPPMSNQLGEWLFRDPGVRDFVKRSNFYMLAQRHEVLFENYLVDEPTRQFRFDLVCGGASARGLSVDMGPLLGGFDDAYEVQAGERIFKLMNCQDMNGEPIYWATTDKLLYDFWRHKVAIRGHVDVLQFTRFELYYVGISKKHDSFTRLFDSGHKSRLKILSNEAQFTPTSRLTDEIYIFLFDVEDLGIKIVDDDDFSIPEALDKQKLVADAEKAFISVLDCKYNEVKYRDYPSGSDGLADEGLTRYAYLIDEDIPFLAPGTEIRGAHGLLDRRRDPDMICIEGELVTLRRADAAVPDGESDA